MNVEEARAKTVRLYERLAQRRPDIEELDNAYAGDQKLQFASKEWSNFHQNMYQGFADNWVAVVADAANERIKIVGVDLGSDDTEKQAARLLWEWWKRNDCETQSAQGFLESIIAKRSAAIVFYDEDGDPQITWEHPGQVYVQYSADNGRRRVAAIKAWVDETTEYATLYTPTEIWKWKRPFTGVDVHDGYTNSGIFVGDRAGSVTFGSGVWEPRLVDGEDWPLSHDLGEVPVVEFPNRPKLKTGAVSDVRGALAMQNAINLFWAYTLGAADYASLPARVVSGQERPKIPILDDEGNVTGHRDVPLSELQKGRILWLTGQNAKAQEWSAADLKQLTDVIEIGVSHLGAQSRTPAHYFVANKGLSNINGETLIATEVPLAKKVEEFQGGVQSGMRALWRLMGRILGGDQLGQLASVATTSWAHPGIRSDAQLSDALMKDRKAGLPLEWLLEKYGESPETISRIMELRAKEAVDPQLQDLIDRVGEDVGG